MAAVSHLNTGKLRLREVKLLAQGHTDGRWEGPRLASDSRTQYPDDTLRAGGINEGGCGWRWRCYIPLSLGTEEGSGSQPWATSMSPISKIHGKERTKARYWYPVPELGQEVLWVYAQFHKK